MDQDRWERKRERWERHWERKRARSHSPGKHIAAGLILMGIGVIFLLGNMGYLDAHKVFSFWPVILIVFGLVRIVESRHHGRTAGVFWVVVGLLFLLGSFGIIRMTLQQAWPILLIGAGAVMLWRAAVVRRARPCLWSPGLSEPEASADPKMSSGTSSTSVFSAKAILGGVERRIISQDFRGGDATAIMGGCNLDFRGALIKPPNPAVLEVFALCGGIEIRIPEDWTVVSELEVILGGVDERKASPPKDASKRFILRGTVLMGGVEVKN